MRRRRWLLLTFALGTLFALASLAQGQGTRSVLLFSEQGGKVLSETNVQLRAEGEIVVSFHGDAVAGCAAYGLCPYSGTIIVRPRTGAADIVTYRVHGRVERQALILLEPAPPQSYSTAARVERSNPGASPGLCADANTSALETAQTSIRKGVVTLRLFAAGGNTLSTRCAGPLDGDLAGVGPTATIPLERLARGRTTVNLSGASTFASHGFAGTVNSTLALVLGRASRQALKAQFPPGIRTTENRTVSEHLTLTRTTGRLGAAIQGVADPQVCRLLDSCGLVGTLGFGGSASHFTGEVLAIGPASRPYRDFLAALGLSAGDPHGISVELTGNFILAPATAANTQSGETCADSAPGEQMFVTLTANHDELRGSAGAMSMRTRCPGPSLTAGNSPLLDAVLPRRALARRAFTIGLTAGDVIDDDGYTVKVHGRLSLVVRRGRISQQVSVAPAG